MSEWNRLVPKVIAIRTGAATVMLDHYGKTATDKRYSIGAQHKRNMITGASYGLEVTEAIGRNRSGGGFLIVAKDRPGYVRGRAVKRDRDLIAGSYEVRHDEHSGLVTVRVTSVLEILERGEDLAVDMTMVKTMHAKLIEAGVPLSGRGWKGTASGKDDRKLAAMEWLVGKGFVLKERVGRADMHRVNPSQPRDW